MLAEPNIHPRAVRETAVELLFEKFQTPALFLAKNAVLSSFASGRQTSLVIDMGYESSVGELSTSRVYSVIAHLASEPFLTFVRVQASATCRIPETRFRCDSIKAHVNLYVDSSLFLPLVCSGCCARWLRAPKVDRKIASWRQASVPVHGTDNGEQGSHNQA